LNHFSQFRSKPRFSRFYYFPWSVTCEMPEFLFGNHEHWLLGSKFFISCNPTFLYCITQAICKYQI